MKTKHKTVSSLTVLFVLVLINYVCAENGLFKNFNMKSANKDIKANTNYRKGTYGNSEKDYRYRGIELGHRRAELGRTLVKPTSLVELEDEQNNKDILDDFQDINDRKELKGEINDREYPIRNDNDQYRDVKDTSDADGIMDENALTKSWDKAKEIKVIMYIRNTNGGHGMPGGSDIEEPFVNNTSLPPMICWEINCSDCVAQESEIRCIVRSFLTVIVRVVIFGIVILLLFACVYISTKKKKCKNAGIKRTGKEVVDRGDKTALIDPA